MRDLTFEKKASGVIKLYDIQTKAAVTNDLIGAPSWKNTIREDGAFTPTHLCKKPLKEAVLCLYPSFPAILMTCL